MTISPQSSYKHINYPAEQDDLSNPQDEVMEKFVTPYTTKAPVIEGISQDSWDSPVSRLAYYIGVAVGNESGTGLGDS